jgi:UrcA family protein
MTRLAPFAFALAALTLPAASAAQIEVRARNDPDTTVYTQDVRFATSDLSTGKGARKVLAAIESAADYVCGGQPDGSSGFDAKAQYVACHRQAMTQAIARAGVPITSVDRPVKTADLH